MRRNPTTRLLLAVAAIGLAIGYLATTLQPLTLWTTVIAAADRDFPCAGHGCGCATAEQCRTSCCCFPKPQPQQSCCSSKRCTATTPDANFAACTGGKVIVEAAVERVVPVSVLEPINAHPPTTNNYGFAPPPSFNPITREVPGPVPIFS